MPDGFIQAAPDVLGINVDPGTSDIDVRQLLSSVIQNQQSQLAISSKIPQNTQAQIQKTIQEITNSITINRGAEVFLASPVTLVSSSGSGSLSVAAYVPKDATAVILETSITHQNGSCQVRQNGSTGWFTLAATGTGDSTQTSQGQCPIDTTSLTFQYNLNVAGSIKLCGYITQLGASSGGSTIIGATTLAGLSDCSITSPQDANLLIYNGGTLKWTNEPMGGDALISDVGLLTLSGTGVSSGTYGNGTNVGQFTVDSKGRLAFAQNVPISLVVSGTSFGSQSANLIFGSNPTAASTPSFQAPGSYLLAKLGTPTYGTIQNLQDFGVSAGQIAGGVISASATANAVDVTAGQGWIKATDSEVATVDSFDWGASTALSVPSNTTRFIGVQYNAGSPVVVAKTTNTWDGHTEFPLGNVVNESGTRYFSAVPWTTSDAMTHVIERFDAAGLVIRNNSVGGVVLGYTGTRNITVSAGALFGRINNFTFSAVDTSGLGTFDYYYRNGSGGFTKQSAQTQFSVTQYDNGTGTLASIPGNNYASVWVYVCLDGSVIAMYGQAAYSNIAGALNDGFPTSTPDRITYGGVLIGRFIVQQGTNTPVQTFSAWTTTIRQGGVTSASDLSNGTTGTGEIVLQTSPTLITPNIGVPTSGTLTNCAGLPIGGIVGGTLGRIAYDNGAVGTWSSAIGANQVLFANASQVPTGDAGFTYGGAGGNPLINLTPTATNGQPIRVSLPASFTTNTFNVLDSANNRVFQHGINTSGTSQIVVQTPSAVGAGSSTLAAYYGITYPYQTSGNVVSQYGAATMQGSGSLATCAALLMVAAEAQASGKLGTDFLFQNCPIGSSTLTNHFRVSANGSAVVGSAALATNAVDGALYIPTMAGASTGTWTSWTGAVALTYDTTNNVLQVYNSSLKKITLGGQSVTLSYQKSAGVSGTLTFTNGVLTANT